MSYVYPRQFFGWGNDGKLAATVENQNRYEYDRTRAQLTTDGYWLSQSTGVYGQPEVRALPPEFLAEVVSSAAAPGTNRWIYTMKPVDLVDPMLTLAANTRDTVDIANSTAGTLTAWNLYELKHGGLRFGDGTLVANLPAGAVLTPIVGVVLLHAIRDNATNVGTAVRYVFDRANGVECPEGEGGGG